MRLLSSYTCGTYIRKPVWPLCVAQNSYSVNGNKQYVLNVEGMDLKYVVIKFYLVCNFFFCYTSNTQTDVVILLDVDIMMFHKEKVATSCT